MFKSNPAFSFSTQARILTANTAANRSNVTLNYYKGNLAKVNSQKAMKHL